MMTDEEERQQQTAAMAVPVPTGDSSSIDFDSSTCDDDDDDDDESVHSVLLAHDLHVTIDDRTLSQLPNRYASGDTKAKLTWFGGLCVKGIGMFMEAFIIITTGQIKTIWESQYPECWIPDRDVECPEKIQCTGLFPNTPPNVDVDTDVCDVATGEYPETMQCSGGVISAVSFTEFAGIMLGMLVFGYAADRIGRKTAGVVTSLFMSVGVTFMTFFYSNNVNTMYAVFAVFFGVYGAGIGGEYPLTASGAAEHHAESVDQARHDLTDEERKKHMARNIAAKAARRGETIGLVFAMQGVGAVFGSLVLICLIFFAEQSNVDCSDPTTNASGNDAHALDAIWRSFYFIGLILVLLVLAFRFFVAEESKSFIKVLERKKKREEKLGQHSTMKILAYYWPRLVGTAGCWYLWDISFYGLKLFTGPIFSQLNPSGSLLVTNLWILLYNVVALVGYYAAALTIDRKRIGRKRLQMLSCLTLAVVFAVTAAIFHTDRTGLKLFLIMASSFFGQFGSNVTTYVMAAEAYPTELRSTCHGISAFLGKAGALTATVVFSYLETYQIFIVTSGVSILTLLCTYVFGRDLTHVSLAEHDAQLELFLQDRPDEYRGLLNKREHLSNFERWVGLHGVYEENWAAKLVEKERAKSSESKPEQKNKKPVHRRISTLGVAVETISSMAKV